MAPPTKKPRLKTTSRPPAAPKGVSKPPAPSKRDKPAPKPKPRARSRSPSDASSDETDGEDLGDYALKPTTTKIPYSSIARSWNPLPTSTLQALHTLLHTAESAVLSSIAPTKAKRPSSTNASGADKQRAVQAFISTLVKSFPKVPVPDGKWEFDVAKIRERGAGVQEMVAAEREAVEDVQREIRRLKKVVDAEQRALEELRKNAKDQEIARAARAKNLHPIFAPSATDSSLLSSHGIPSIVLDTSPTSHALREYDISADASLSKLESSLKMHLGSIQQNLAQVERVGNALARSRAVVREVVEECGREDLLEGVEGRAMERML